MQSIWTQTEIDHCYNLALRFRQAIEHCDPVELPITLQNYPRGACGDAAYLLSKYLQQNGYEQFEYVLGERDDHSHAWLQRGGLILDITANQFEDNDEPVIVRLDSAWHASFEVIEVHNGDFETRYHYDLSTVKMLRSAYHLISAHLVK